MLKKLFIHASALAVLILLTFPAHGTMPSALKKRVGIPPVEVLREILATNHSGSRDHNNYRDKTTPYLTWLADSDPRLNSRSVLPAGYLMITVQNPGGQLAVSPGSLDYGIHELHAPVLLITGVSDSRHINYYLSGYQNLNNSLRMDLDHLHLPLNREAGITLERESSEEKLLRLVKANIQYQVKQALTRYHDRVKEGRLVVIGSVFDTTNHYGKGEKKLIILNINGHQGDKLRDLPLIRQLKPDLREYVVMDD